MQLDRNNRRQRIVLMAAAIAGLGGPVQGQVSVVERLEITGVVEAAAGGRLTVRDPQGRRHEVRVQAKGERGVALADGRLLEFPAAVRVTGGFDLAKLKPGQVVTFAGRLNGLGRSEGELPAGTLVVETTAAVTERGDEKLATKYRGLSDEPKTEPRLVRSAHFAFLTDVSDREAKIILDKLERMAGLLEKYFGRGPVGPIEGFIARDLATFPPGVLEEPEGAAKIREGAGICFNARFGNQRKATLYSCADHGVIQHECTHGFCHMTFGSTGPTWLAEGVAELGNYWKEGEAAVDVEPVVMAYLRQAQPKRGLLEIAVPGRTPPGTWQDYAWRWALCHMLAFNPNYADRFKPLAIALMEERPGVSFESVYGPVAKQVSFEYDEFLRHVGNGYRADLTAWPWKARFRKPQAAAGLRATVKARAGWQSSGLEVERAARYAVQAEGGWRTAPTAAPCTAAGDPAGHGRLEGAVLAEADTGFTLSAPFAVGERGTFTAPADGRLFLRCADDWTQLADNDGEIEVVLRRAAEGGR